MWGRIMNIDVSTYTDENGNTVLYAVPSNLSPAGEEYEALVAERVEKIKEANPDRGDTPIPEDLVTCSGSGLDPHISAPWWKNAQRENSWGSLGRKPSMYWSSI